MSVAILLFASSFASYLHVATIRHARCPEHGELVHLSPAPAAHAPDTGASMAAAVTPGAAGTALDEAPPGTLGGDEHDHCELCPSTRERTCLSTHDDSLAAPASEQSRSQWTARTLQLTSELYIIAPKNSPPV